MAIDDGGTAYPKDVSQTGGITVFDYYMSSALHAIISNKLFEVNLSDLKHDTRLWAVKEAINFANIVMEERAKLMA